MLRSAEVIADSDVKALAYAIWTHKLVVVKGQQHIRPIKQWELVTRLDPKAPLVHSHGDVKTFNKQGGLLSVYSDLGRVVCTSTDSIASAGAMSMVYLALRTFDSLGKATKGKITSV
jgi:hypothetical protein